MQEEDVIVNRIANTVIVEILNAHNYSLCNNSCDNEVNYLHISPTFHFMLF